MVFRRFAPAMAVLLGVVGAGAAVATAAGPYVCSGKLHSPGILKGTYKHGVVVKGVCAVKNGKAHVFGTLTVTKGSALGAAFGRHHSSLTVTGNVVVDKGAVAILGCKVNPNGSGIACLDEPNMKHPTLTSHEVVTGSIIESSPLAVIVHNSAIRGSIKEIGGGGGLSCAPPKSGVFAAIMSPVYSDYEDNSVGGNIVIKNINSCWLGVGREKIGGSVTIDNNEMADPDAIEVFSNDITKNLACSGNGHPAKDMLPDDQPVWDSGEIPTNGAIYPRHPQPNTVGGSRSGQCVTATPLTQGGTSSGAF